MKQLKNCKECNAKLKGRYKRFCGKPACREAAKKEHNEQCRIRNGKDKPKACECGCGQVFPTGINGRQYYSSACRSRVALSKKNAGSREAFKKQECKICGAGFVPRNQRHVTCSPDCAKKAKRQKDERRYKRRVPATHRPGSALWDGVKRDDDYDHKQYIEYKKQLKAKNGRTCREDGCANPCFGFNRYCDECRERVYRKAANCGFLEEGGSRQSASGIYG